MRLKRGVWMPVEPGGMVAGLAEHWGMLQYATLEVVGWMDRRTRERMVDLALLRS